MSYPSDLTDDQWELLEPVFNAPGKRGRKHADDLQTVVDTMLYIAQTGCQWRYLPHSFGPWTRAWSQFRRWSRNGTWAQALTVLHAAARESDGRAERTPSMVVIDTWPAAPQTVASPSTTAADPTAAPRGRARCRRRRDRSPGGRAGRSRLNPQEPGQRADAGAPGAAGCDRPARAGSGRPRGHGRCARTLGRGHDIEVRRVGWDDKQPPSGPSGTPGVSRSPTAASDAAAGWRSRSRTPPPRRPAGSRSPASPRRCATCPESGTADAQRHSPPDRPPTRSARNAA